MKKEYRFTQKRCLVVLGMHRSGTSAATGVLSLMGAKIGTTVMPTTSMNPKGFFENQRIREINDRLLAALGTSWDGPFACEAGWDRSDALASIRNEAARALAEEFEPGHLIGIKDPRLCLLLPFWQPLLDALDLQPAFVIVVRHPLEVAASLEAGYGFSTPKGVLLWTQHMLSAEESTRGQCRLFLSFNDLLARPRVFAERAASELGVAFSRTWKEAESRVRQFLDPGLKHHAEASNLPVTGGTEEAMRYYDILCRLADGANGREPAAETEAVDRIRERFLQGLKRFYHPDLLALAARATRAAETEAALCGQVDRLQQQLSDCGRLASEAALRERLIARLAVQGKELFDALVRSREELAGVRGELQVIKGSKAWRMAEHLRRWIYSTRYQGEPKR